MALDEVGNDLTTWARALADDRMTDDLPASNDELGAIKVACWFLGSNLTSVATLDWAGLLIVALADHEERLRTLTEQVAPGWYAGECQRDGCAAPTYVVPGLTWVTCRECGATTYAHDHLDIVLGEARGWIAPPMRLAEAVVALTETETSIVRLYERIKKWGQREHIETIRRLDRDGDPCGPKKHRLSEVLDLLNREGATRLDGSHRRAS
ncbi:hypothetical protein [Nocardioides sp. REDSEA-S30_B4]|uniref:hypothetical protein n=1 Tax=Nocardioides sp. REDSEA-S30_B4 TaxID=1811552 RepID=UPI0025DE6E04|nr:hypothetical protein [Nocardioides sp. REDSEA-S30_B4]